MKKVLHVLASNTFSGAENVAVTIINELGDKYQMAYCSPDGKIREALNERNILFYPLHGYSLKKIIKQFEPEIIHAHDYKSSCYASLISKNIPVISHIHGNNLIFNRKNIFSMTYKLFSKKFKKIIWVSNSAFDNYYFKDKVKEKSVILYNIINEKEVNNKSNLYECKDTYDLIFLGRLSEPKNPERLIQLFNNIVSENKEIKLAIVGDGELRKNVEELIQKYNLGNNITMYGFQSNPYPILKKSKMLIMVSKYEGTPMCALEALSLGIPVISTPVDGLKKIIVNGKNGFLYDSNEELAQCIMNLCSDNEKLKIMSENAKEQFKIINNSQKYFDTINRIYEDIV